MIDEIFACPVRKYNISDSEISKWANSLYDNQKFNMPSPFKLNFTNMEAWVTQQYTDVLEEFVKEIGLGDTHVGIITDSILCVLEKGETLGNCNTLPSHYTLTHFIEGVSPDVYYHPAKTLLEVFNPGLDEWGSAVSLYLNQGDVILHPSYLEFSTPPVEHKRVTHSMMIQLQPK